MAVGPPRSRPWHDRPRVNGLGNCRGALSSGKVPAPARPVCTHGRKAGHLIACRHVVAGRRVPNMPEITVPAPY